MHDSIVYYLEKVHRRLRSELGIGSKCKHRRLEMERSGKKPFRDRSNRRQYDWVHFVAVMSVFSKKQNEFSLAFVFWNCNSGSIIRISRITGEKVTTKYIIFLTVMWRQRPKDHRCVIRLINKVYELIYYYLDRIQMYPTNLFHIFYYVFTSKPLETFQI